MPISAVDAAHLLRRTGFGVEVDERVALEASADRYAAIDRVLDLSEAPPEDQPAYRSRLGSLENQRRLVQWWIERMRTTPTPIVEKMTMFWHNHFVSALGKVPSIPAMRAQHSLFRSHALGNFHDLAQDVSLDPAMLVYLDNWMNVRWKPQENFARELMELFTLGVGAFTEQDVVSMTKAWTGHSLAADYTSHRFYEQYHEAEPSVLFGLPPRAWDGPDALTEITRGTKAVESSEFIAAKVFSAFAYPVDRGDPVVGPIATEFRSSGLSILALVRSVLRSDAFWSERARNGLVRSPIEWMVAGMQAIGLDADTCQPSNYLESVGQVPFNHPGVDGWKQNEYWLSTATSWGRSAWSADVRVAAHRAGVFAGVYHLPPEEIVQHGFDRFGIDSPSPRTRTVLEEWAARSVADGDHYLIPANLVHLLLLSPDFQKA